MADFYSEDVTPDMIFKIYRGKSIRVWLVGELHEGILVAYIPNNEIIRPLLIKFSTNIRMLLHNGSINNPILKNTIIWHEPLSGGKRYWWVKPSEIEIGTGKDFCCGFPGEFKLMGLFCRKCGKFLGGI